MFGIERFDIFKEKVKWFDCFYGIKVNVWIVVWFIVKLDWLLFLFLLFKIGFGWIIDYGKMLIFFIVRGIENLKNIFFLVLLSNDYMIENFIN